MLGLALLPSARGSRWPQYGGTLRVELRAASVSLDPREWKPERWSRRRNEKMGALVFSTGLSLWTITGDSAAIGDGMVARCGFKRWVFTLRPDVKLSDGTLLSAADVAAALQPLLPRWPANHRLRE